MYNIAFDYLKNSLFCFIKLLNNGTKSKCLSGLNITVFILNKNQKPDIIDLKAEQDRK